MKWILAFFLICSIKANTEFSMGTSEFLSKEDDSFKFVKKQLLHIAFKDIVTKELKKFSLDSDLFWKRYDEKFEEYFSEEKKKIKENLKIVEGEKISKEVQEKYEKKIRFKKLTWRVQFYGLSRFISSYSIKKMGSISGKPLIKRLVISGKVNQKKLQKHYIATIIKEDVEKFSNLYVSVDIKKRSMSWEDVGVFTGVDFVSEIEKFWKLWMDQNYSDYFSEIVMTNKVMATQIESSLSVLSDESNSNDIFFSISNLQNSLLCKIKIEIEKVNKKRQSKKKFLKFKGNIIFLNLRTSRPIYSIYIPTKELQFNIKENSQDLVSEVATKVYQEVILSLEKMEKSIFFATKKRKYKELVVEDIGNISHLIKFNESLIIKGVVLQLHSEIFSYDGSKGVLKMHYRGEEEKLQSFFDKKINKQLFFSDIAFEFSGEPLSNKGRFKKYSINKVEN